MRVSTILLFLIIAVASLTDHSIASEISINGTITVHTIALMTPTSLLSSCFGSYAPEPREVNEFISVMKLAIIRVNFPFPLSIQTSNDTEILFFNTINHSSQAYGLTRLICGTTLIESHPPSSSPPSSTTSFYKQLPFLIPFPSLDFYSHPMLSLLLPFSPWIDLNHTSNTYTGAILLDHQSIYKDSEPFLSEDDLMNCEIRFLSPHSQNYDLNLILKNSVTNETITPLSVPLLYDTAEMNKKRSTNKIDSTQIHNALKASLYQLYSHLPLSSPSILTDELSNDDTEKTFFLQTKTNGRIDMGLLISSDMSMESMNRLGGKTSVEFIQGLLQGLIGPVVDPLGDVFGGIVGGFMGDLVINPVAKLVASGLVNGVVDALSPSLTDIVKNIAPGVIETSKDSVIHALAESLSDYVTLHLTPIITTDVTKELTSTLVPEVSEKTSTESATNISRQLISSLTHILSRSVSQSLAPALVNTMTLNLSPQTTYFCYFCYHQKIYCLYCHQTMQLLYKRLYYTNYYTAYYSQYYGNYYANLSRQELGIKLVKRNKPPLGTDFMPLDAQV